MWISVIDRRYEQLLDSPGINPADEIEDRARLVVGAAGPRAAEGLLADDRSGRLVVDVEVAGGETERLGGSSDRRPVLGDDRAGQRVRGDVGRLRDNAVVVR